MHKNTQSKPGCRFMVLSYAFCEGYESYYLNEHGVPVLYDSIEDALADIQSEFDRWADEVRSGEREPEDSFDEEEFLVSCANTGTNCRVANVHGTIFLIDEFGNFLKSKAEMETINLTGDFVHIES
ncbi:MAG: hypothetical protein WAO76_11825 [Georgfuchsia sp.]